MNDKPFISISVLLRGDQLNPEDISSILGLRSVQSQKKGEKKKNCQPNANPAIAKIGLWRGARIKSKSRSVPDIVSDVLCMFGEHQQALNRMPGVDEALLDIFLILHRMNEPEEFILSEDQICRIGELGLSVRVTASCSDDKDH